MNNPARVVRFVNAKGESDFLFTVESMLDPVIDAILSKGATNITVSIMGPEFGGE